MYLATRCRTSKKGRLAVLETSADMFSPDEIRNAGVQMAGDLSNNLKSSWPINACSKGGIHSAFCTTTQIFTRGLSCNAH